MRNGDWAFNGAFKCSQTPRRKKLLTLLWLAGRPVIATVPWGWKAKPSDKTVPWMEDGPIKPPGSEKKKKGARERKKKRRRRQLALVMGVVLNTSLNVNPITSSLCLFWQKAATFKARLTLILISSPGKSVQQIHIRSCHPSAAEIRARVRVHAEAGVFVCGRLVCADIRISEWQ